MSDQTAAAIAINEPNPRWPEIFESLRHRLAAALGDVALRIEHVGSTSVPGLAAKPIIDIDVVIEDRSRLPDAITRLASINYQHQGDLGIPGREAFRSTIDLPRHHLYVCARDAAELRRHLTFRDHLRASADDRDRYAALKKRLAQSFSHDIEGYVRGKSDFIETVLARCVGAGAG